MPNPSFSSLPAGGLSSASRLSRLLIGEVEIRMLSSRCVRETVQKDASPSCASVGCESTCSTDTGMAEEGGKRARMYSPGCIRTVEKEHEKL